MKKAILTLAIAVAVLPACATKKYVSREVGEVNQKVETLSGEVEKTQQRVQRNEGRIEEVNAGVTEARGTADRALTQAAEAERAAKGKLVYTVTLSNDKVTFPVNRALVGDDAKAVIDEAVAQFKAENRGVFFEIEGHTDNTGPEAHNTRLGEERATAVRNYLHDQHGIALNRISVISYGESKPAVDNKTRANRSANRRVVIRVLE